MKKLFLSLLLMVSALAVNAQIFDTLEKRNKFDDVLKKENIKTLITINELDSVITIETKGRKAQDYIIINDAPYSRKGDKDNIVNLVNDVWGYQMCWTVVKKEDISLYWSDYEKVMNDELPMETMKKYWKWFTERVVTTQYAHTFIDRVMWLSEPDESRTIFYNK